MVRFEVALIHITYSRPLQTGWKEDYQPRAEVWLLNPNHVAACDVRRCSVRILGETEPHFKARDSLYPYKLVILVAISHNHDNSVMPAPIIDGLSYFSWKNLKGNSTPI